MPHMMPMAWLLLLLSTLLVCYLTMNLIYFFYLPMLPLKNKNIKKYQLNKWTWKW